MLTYSDIGIILEILGFFFFLIAAKRMPQHDVMGLESSSEKPVSKYWKFLYWELQGNKSQTLRLLAIILIIGGLSLQLSLFMTT